jgi:predicted ATPase
VSMIHVSLNIDEVKELLKFKFRQIILNPGLKVRPIYIEGHAGIGKTQIVRQAALEVSRELESELKGEMVECRVINLQFTERPEFMGLGYNVQEETEMVMKYSRPLLIPSSGYGFYFMDEANRTDRDIRSGMLTLLEDREVNGHKMGPFWLLVLAGNLSDDSKYETNDMDVALRDRIAKVIMVGDANITISHLNNKYHNHPLMDFLKANPDFLSFTGDGCSPRSFEYALRATLDFDMMNEDLLYRALAAEVGVQGASTIAAFLKDRDVPTYEKVLSGQPDAMTWIRKNKGRNDVVSSLSRKLVADLKERQLNNKKFYDEEVLALKNYIETISDEHKLSIITEVKKESLIIPFMATFIQGTPMTDFFIKMYATTADRPPQDNK